jgi:hypothetical protein
MFESRFALHVVSWTLAPSRFRYRTSTQYFRLIGFAVGGGSGAFG